MKRKTRRQAKATSIRSRLTGVVAVPAVILLVMWAVFSTFTIFDGIYIRDTAAAVKGGAIPAVNTLSALQRERQATIAALIADRPDLIGLTEQQQTTDLSLRDFTAALEEMPGSATPEVDARLKPFVEAVTALPDRRIQVGGGNADKVEIYRYYNSLLDAGFALFDTQARELPDADMVESTLTMIEVIRAGDRMSRASSLAAIAIAAGGFTPDQHVEFVGLVGSYRTALATQVDLGTDPLKGAFQRLAATQAWGRLVADENRLIVAGPKAEDTGSRRSQPPAPPVSAQDWESVSGTAAEELIKLATQQVAGAVDVVVERADARFRTGLIGSLVALFLVVLGMVAASVFARRLIDKALVTRLEGLKTDSLRLAHERLPDIVDRLRQGARVDVGAEVPPLDYGTDEIGQVADAFNAAQYTAIAAAVKESQAREGVNRVFLGIAHRHQGLVHRQLKILDKIEREEENPEHLDALFQLDHLATRARRNAENLIILAGEQPGRQWRKPVRLLDILRAAVAETEQYVRVRVRQVPDVALHGVAVADTIHLVAELVDNAASFSPPRSQVEVYTSLVSGGVVVEIEDHGLGMTAEDREAANQMLAYPPEFDAMALRGESRLGLFVVARLAVRRSIRVELRESPYGGTVALVFLPSDIVVEAVEADHGAPSPRPRQQTLRTPRKPEPEVRYEPPVGPAFDRMWSDVAGSAEDTLWPQVDAEEAMPPQRTYSVTEPVSRNGSRSAELPRRERTDNGVGEPAKVDEARQGAGQTAPPLPRRKRQQHLAPQLREEPPSEVELPDREHSPERIRSTMAAFQRGTQDARRADPPVEP
ncbi:membrane protein SC1C221c [Alloactinosynnema sp. L-07]|uniref:sensor histidine kinase n=1 Tax=Alloactinosynnema sp. L-07 TaxID=1653480 RepID=UPI00065F04B8|nr:nitrate- and nitrite sensing domain-containing protein [Alloactinosynnema sp. L-07]CRK57444.1 membrane protein SC1C221c [Alloactinosynnema sp. L-07]